MSNLEIINPLVKISIMIRKPIQAVSEFHKAFGLSIENKPTANISSDISNLRYNLMKEENEEYLEATKK